MTKIIGFLISKEKIEIDIDFFNIGLKAIKISHKNYNLYLWGTGDIESYKTNGKYSLSFPLHDNLLDRNVLISIEDEGIIIENDWLGSIPIFYNKKEKIISTLSNFCIKSKTIHIEGLMNFCEFGYSVFEQTIFEDIKFMRYYSKLTVTNQDIKVENKKDPVLQKEFLSKTTTTNDVISSMQTYITRIEDSINGEIVLPTSGGYDSRILNHLIKDKSRIRSFTYGITSDQSKSTEVVYAKRISQIYNTKWEQIKLENFYKYIDKWIKIYGISTHTHGMYHIEFFIKILKKYKLKAPTFLSGIIGDAWAEFGKIKDINSYSDIINLGYTHGMNLDLEFLAFKEGNKIKELFFIENHRYLKNEKIKSIFAMRTKLILLSYLTQMPEYFGMPVWTPFLNYDIVKTTINLPDQKRKDRVWQKDFFRSVGLDLEDMRLRSTKSNSLDYDIARKTSFEPIDEEIMQKYIAKEKLEKVNKSLKSISAFEVILNKILNIPKVGGLLRRLGYKNNLLVSLNEYYVIKAIEKGLKHES